MAGRHEAELVLVGGLISRLIVQTSQQSGLSAVYTELLDFSGDEIYFHEEPALTGRTFGEALLMYEDSALIGVRTADGRVRLNRRTIRRSSLETPSSRPRGTTTRSGWPAHHSPSTKRRSWHGTRGCRRPPERSC